MRRFSFKIPFAVIFIMFCLTGCTWKIEMDSLHWGHLLGDISQYYDVPTDVSSSTIFVNTKNKFNKKAYLRKLGVKKGADVIEGFLYPPDLDSAIIYVSGGNNTIQIEMSVLQGSINSLKIWESKKLRYEFEGAFYNIPTPDHDISSYIFGSGIQRVYKDCKADYKKRKGDPDYKVYTEYRCILERSSTYDENNSHFTIVEKKYHEKDLKEGYYKVDTVVYNESDSGNTFFAGRHYEKKLVSVNYHFADMRKMLPHEFMLLEKKPYLIFQSDYISQGRMWYMVLFPNSSDSNCSGIFFTLVGEDFSTLQRESIFIFDIDEEPDELAGNYCHIRTVLKPEDDDYASLHGSCCVEANQTADLTIDITECWFEKKGLTSNAPNAHAVFSQYNRNFQEGEEELLMKYIKDDYKKKNELERERSRASWGSSSSKVDVGDIRVKCPACYGTGKSTQMPGYSCPGCNGKGTVPYWHLQMRGMP